MKKIVFLTIYLLFFEFAEAQTEKHTRQIEIPDKMIDYIRENYPNYSKIRFYKEAHKDKVYYESVFWFDNEEYNLLFDVYGNLYETEITLTFKELPTQIGQKIKDYLMTDFIKYKITKTQEVEANHVFLYEIAIRGRSKTEKGFYEVYFDRAGSFIKKDLIKLKSIQSRY